MAQFKDVAIEGTAYLWVGLNDTGGSGADLDSGTLDFDVRLAGATASDAPIYSSTGSLLSHANYPAGCYELAIACTTGNGFAAGNEYAVFATGLVDSQNPTGFAGSIRVTTSGAAPANVTHVSGDSTAADNLEAIMDGTGAVMTLSQLRINSSSANGAVDIDNSAGPGVKVNGGGLGGDGVSLAGNAGGSGLSATGGASGHGIKATGGTTSGDGIIASPGIGGSGVDVNADINGTIDTVTTVTNADAINQGVLPLITYPMFWPAGNTGTILFEVFLRTLNRASIATGNITPGSCKVILWRDGSGNDLTAGGDIAGTADAANHIQYAISASGEGWDPWEAGDIIFIQPDHAYCTHEGNQHYVFSQGTNSHPFYAIYVVPTNPWDLECYHADVDAAVDVTNSLDRYSVGPIDLRDGTQPTPSAVTIEVDEDDGDQLFAAQAMAIDADTGAWVYETATQMTAGRNYKATVVMTIGGTDYTVVKTIYRDSSA